MKSILLVALLAALLAGVALAVPKKNTRGDISNLVEDCGNQLAMLYTRGYIHNS
jgi:hypothetical protein